MVSYTMTLLLLISLPIISTYLLLKRRKSVKTLVPPGPPALPSAKLAEQVLKTQDLAFCNRPKLLGQQKLSYNCLDMVFSPYGDYWREVRKIAAVHLLSLRKIQSFRPIREDEISRMVAKISDLASSQKVVDLSEIAMALSSTLICRIAFGKRYEEKGSEMRRFDELLHDDQAVMGTFFVSDYFPSFSWVDKITGFMDWLYRTYKKLDSFYQELIDEHLDPNYRAKMGEEEKDILDILIQLKEQRSCSIDLNWDQIKALLMIVPSNSVACTKRNSRKMHSRGL